MHVIATEFIKLKRSMSWAIVILLPIVFVLLGTVMTITDGTGLEDGWNTLWLRSFVFYGLFPLPVGIAILASLSWRPEHRGSNWNALMSGPTPSLRIVAAKALTVALLAAIMQIIALAVVVLLGKLVFGLPGFLPSTSWGVFGMIVLGCLPVAALQSGLSVAMRSFAAPIAVAFVGSGFSALLLVIKLDSVMFLSPYAALTRATQLGTGAFADTGTITGAILIMIGTASALLTAIVTVVNTAFLERGDAHT